MQVHVRRQVACLEYLPTSHRVQVKQTTTNRSGISWADTLFTEITREINMPIVNHQNLTETPWRPNYRKWDITDSKDGSTSSNLSYSVASPGSGAPLHFHESDELIVLLEGELEVSLAGETKRVGPDQTVVIPPNVPHGFTVVGSEDARMLAFFPVSDPFDHTTYLEGNPPGAHD